MENQTTLQKLNDKISDVLSSYAAAKEELERLRLEVVTLKSEKEMKNKEIEKLIEQNTLKDLEIEEIVEKIERMMG
jgi:chromosome segregation ATPase